MREIAQNTNSSFSIQNEKTTFVPLTSYLPGTQVVLTSKTGLIGTPQQTNEGINIKCLLNPLIKVGGLVNIDNASIQDLQINISSKNSAANNIAPLSQDGVYYVLVVDYIGDTRGVDWYCNLRCLISSPSSNPTNAVQVGG